ncbi:hypothetical protein [Merismopedia glauca]|uniref:Uncharacterized protein n=1 Tax=Merismopedia glauca CCAP 1448/3 TaxID=1296344 RepID=A0A2T1C1T3_9CYAN|nr:hypothetical protein [Merismopedia glauca]PSB02236.1 hypothetical protein C7B64_14260 [Merismopedia glauca CCAP 1448/3]
MPSLEPIEPSLFADLAQHGEGIFERSLEFQLALAQHPKVTPEILKFLVERGKEAVAEVAALHVNWAGELTTACSRS